MAGKAIYFSNTYVGYATKATMKDEIASEKTPTFTETLVDGDPNPAVTVSIEALRAGTIQQYINLEKAIKEAKTTPITVMVRSTDKAKDGTLDVKEYAYNCLISGDEIEIDPVKRTAVKLELTGSVRQKMINGNWI